MLHQAESERPLETPADRIWLYRGGHLLTNGISGSTYVKVVEADYVDLVIPSHCKLDRNERCSNLQNGGCTNQAIRDGHRNSMHTSKFR